jgi:hypothetical protein
VVLQGNRFFGMHWFYRPEDTCLLVDRNMVKKKAKELAKADLAAWNREKERCPEGAAAILFGFLCFSVRDAVTGVAPVRHSKLGDVQQTSI